MERELSEREWTPIRMATEMVRVGREINPSGKGHFPSWKENQLKMDGELSEREWKPIRVGSQTVRAGSETNPSGKGHSTSGKGNQSELEGNLFKQELELIEDGRELAEPEWTPIRIGRDTVRASWETNPSWKGNCSSWVGNHSRTNGK